jgi:hypothetical protein
MKWVHCRTDKVVVEIDHSILPLFPTRGVSKDCAAQVDCAERVLSNLSPTSKPLDGEK